MAFVDVVTCGLGGVFVLMIVVAALQGEAPTSAATKTTLQGVVARIALGLEVPPGGFLELETQDPGCALDPCLSIAEAGELEVIRDRDSVVEPDEELVLVTFTRVPEASGRWCATAERRSLTVRWRLVSASTRSQGDCRLDLGEKVCLDRSSWRPRVECGG